MGKGKQESLGELLVQSMEEAVAIERGEKRPVRAYVVTARQASVVPPPRYDPARVLKVRERMNLSQPVFAAALNVSPHTVRAWEQGKRTPEGAAERLLEVAEASPQTFLRTVTARKRARPPTSRPARSKTAATRTRTRP